jgi:iron-sulfur cluster assembly protein
VNTEGIDTMLQVTIAAANEVLAAAARSGAVGMALRVAARQVADGAIEYGIGFDDEREDDLPVRCGGLTVLVGSPSRPLLAGIVLDYLEVEPGRFDFVFVPADEAAAAPDDVAVPAKADGGCGGGACGHCGS